MKIKLNKKGDIPITLFVLGVFVVCSLAILTFIKADLQTKNSFSGVSVMRKANIDIEWGGLEHYYLDKKIKVFSPNLGLTWIKEKTIFSVEYNP